MWSSQFWKGSVSAKDDGETPGKFEMESVNIGSSRGSKPATYIHHFHFSHFKKILDTKCATFHHLFCFPLYSHVYVYNNNNNTIIITCNLPRPQLHRFWLRPNWTFEVLGFQGHHARTIALCCLMRWNKTNHHGVR